MEDKGRDRNINSDPGYSVEYLPPKPENWKSGTLLEIFSCTQKKLALNNLGGLIEVTPQKIEKNDNSYVYTIPFEQDNGQIAYEYDDYVAEMTDFDEFMHTYRGKCKISIVLKIPSIPNGRSYRLKKFLQNQILTNDSENLGIDYREYESDCELGISDSEYVWLLDGSEDYCTPLYNWTLSLWKKIEFIKGEIKDISLNSAIEDENIDKFFDTLLKETKAELPNMETGKNQEFILRWGDSFSWLYPLGGKMGRIEIFWKSEENIIKSEIVSTRNKVSQKDSRNIIEKAAGAYEWGMEGANFWFAFIESITLQDFDNLNKAKKLASKIVKLYKEVEKTREKLIKLKKRQLKINFT